MKKSQAIRSHLKLKPDEEVDMDLEVILTTMELPFSFFMKKLIKANIKKHMIQPSK